MATANDIFAGQVPNFDTEFPPWHAIFTRLPTGGMQDNTRIPFAAAEWKQKNFLHPQKAIKSLAPWSSNSWWMDVYAPSFGDNLW